MKLPFELKYIRDEKEALDFAKYNILQKQKMLNLFYRLSFVPIAGTGLYSMYLYFNNVHSYRVILYLSFFVIMLCAAIIFSVFMDFAFAAMVKGMSLPVECDLLFTEDGLTLNIADKKAVIKWSNIKIQKYKSSVIIYGMYESEQNNMPLCIITSNAFTSITADELINEAKCRYSLQQ